VGVGHVVPLSDKHLVILAYSLVATEERVRNGEDDYCAIPTHPNQFSDELLQVLDVVQHPYGDR